MSKPIIFISGYCEYCKELMTNLMIQQEKTSRSHIKIF